jgi:hypothetical protein
MKESVSAKEKGSPKYRKPVEALWWFRSCDTVREREVSEDRLKARWWNKGEETRGNDGILHPLPG